MDDLKIGISFNPYGNTFARYGNKKFQKLKECGYSAVDYNISDTNGTLYSLDEHTLKQTILAERSAAAQAQIIISQVHGPWRSPPQDTTADDREERLEKMKKAVIITSLLGCKHLVIHPIMPFGIEDISLNQEQDTWNLNLDFFIKLVDFAEKYDVTICLENMPMPRFSIATPKKILEFVKAINKDNFKVCLDTGHVVVFPELSVGDEVRRLGDYLRVVHIHDNVGDGDFHLYPTKGVIDWMGFLNAVDEIGYSGALSLETSPSGDLEDDAFEKESVNLYNIFKNLVLEHKKNDI